MWIKAFITLSSCVTAAFTLTAPGPTNVTLRQFAHGGTGCPSGSMGVYLNVNGDQLSLLLGAPWTSAINVAVPVTQARKNCQASFNITFEGAYRMCVDRTIFRGQATLDPGVRGTNRNVYYFSGASSQVRIHGASVAISTGC